MLLTTEMFERIMLNISTQCTDRARRVMILAREGADEYIGPEHLLLGIFDEGECEAARLLRRHGVTRDEILRVIDSMIIVVG